MWLDHVSKSGDFFLNFGPILGIENLKKHEVFSIFSFAICSIVFTTYPTSNIQATCRFLVGSKK
jgi:hypothetical protein